MPLLSIIIPCYNSGQFLPDALESIKLHPDKSIYEVIIVDDGSTDKHTLSFLGALPETEYTVIYQTNKGPAAARNTGIRASKGEYVLFLDSDNKIRPAYIDAGIAVLSKQPLVGVVYGNAAFFGTTTVPQFAPQEFDMLKILKGNYIDMCSIIRKSVWLAVGGLDENRSLIGHEDWDFWIRIGATNWGFLYINETLFDYRVRENSLIKQATQPVMYQAMMQYIYSKNLALLLENYQYIHSQFSTYKYDQENPFRSFLKYFYYKYLKAVKIRQRLRFWAWGNLTSTQAIGYPRPSLMS